MTLVYDPEDATVESIAEVRRESSLAAYFEVFPEENRAAIDAISLDMWPADINACRDTVPGADNKMVFDRYHIMRHVLDALDRVGKREHKALRETGDETLMRSKYLWLTNPENLKEESEQRFDELRRMELKTAKAWTLKESLRELWGYPSLPWTTRFWKRCHFLATHSCSAPMIHAAKLIARHLPNVLTYFRHRIINAVAEGLNAKIATVQKRACGYRNWDNFKITLYLYCGGLSLYAARATHTRAR